ncbi:hypothetical protein [Hydrogenimonas sp. SS33]|uniref:hypothetical protein n=1 Tax=Hydrogenimonas leucolamina TaxID=2954236 RepID=UPI00336C1719
MHIEIPRYGTLEIKSVVLDDNGTLAKDGTLLKDAEPLLKALGEAYNVSDLACRHIMNALALLLKSKRLLATLRR